MSAPVQASPGALPASWAQHCPEPGDSVGWVLLLGVGSHLQQSTGPAFSVPLRTSFSGKTKNMPELLFPFTLCSCDVLEVSWEVLIYLNFLTFLLEPDGFIHFILLVLLS